jgi:basic amino acid/polyamine antiporter, APA family
MLMTLTPFPQLVVYIGFSLTCFTTLSVASLFVFRRRPEWQRMRAVSFAYPLIPAAYLVVGTAMIVYGIIWQPKASLTALATIGAGAAVYHFGVRPNNSSQG